MARSTVLVGLVLAGFVAIATNWYRLPSEAAFVGTAIPSAHGLRGVQAPWAYRVARRAAEEEATDVAEDAEDFEEETGEELAIAEGEETLPDVGRAYPPEAYLEYAYNEDPPQSWWDRRKIDRHKVNMLIFDMFKKPKSFFPHDLRPGDAVRIYFLDPTKDDEESHSYEKAAQVYFDGVILSFGGNYHGRTIRLRAMVGSKENAVGYEMVFPIHSPLLQKIEVLRRGYIGRNKNAYFLRGMVGKRNQIPLDKERTRLDELYASLRDAGREDEIPESDYPQLEHERYPLPVWKQDMDEWDEEKYDPDLVDQRSEYERRYIGGMRKKIHLRRRMS